MGVPVSKQRLWAWGRRPNHTQRVTTTLSHVPDEMPLLEIKEFREGVSVRGGLARQRAQERTGNLQCPLEQGWLDPSICEEAAPSADY